MTAEQAVLLDKVLEDMDSLELNAQLEAVTAAKQDILDQMQALEEDESQRDLRASRQREMEAWLDQQPMCFVEYDDCQRQPVFGGRRYAEGDPGYQGLV